MTHRLLIYLDTEMSRLQSLRSHSLQSRPLALGLQIDCIPPPIPTTTRPEVTGMFF